MLVAFVTLNTVTAVLPTLKRVSNETDHPLILFVSSSGATTSGSRNPRTRMSPEPHSADYTRRSRIDRRRGPYLSLCSTVSRTNMRLRSNTRRRVSIYFSQSVKLYIVANCTGNRLHLRGTELAASGQAAKGLNSTGGGILTSPFFPARYPRDLGLEYVVTCPSEAPACRIRLLFSDFQLATVSIMEASNLT